MRYPKLALPRGIQGKAVCVNAPVRICAGLCQERVPSGTRCCIRDEGGPSEPACRSRFQSCCRPMTVVVNVTEKA